MLLLRQHKTTWSSRQPQQLPGAEISSSRRRQAKGGGAAEHQQLGLSFQPEGAWWIKVAQMSWNAAATWTSDCPRWSREQRRAEAVPTGGQDDCTSTLFEDATRSVDASFVFCCLLIENSTRQGQVALGAGDAIRARNSHHSGRPRTLKERVS